jgi:Holliday junction resolvasome, endonuclease subunit
MRGRFGDVLYLCDHDMSHSDNSHLAVDPGVRYMGIAVLVGDELVRVEVENIRDAGMSTDEVARQAQRILEQWIDRYRPDVLAVELPEFAQSKASRQLRQLVRAITITGRKAGLEVRPYVPTTVRRRMCSHDRPTRLAVAREVAERFAWLAPYYQKEAERS